MPDNARPYIEHQSEEVQPASEHKLWVGTQDNKGVFKEPGATDVYMLTARASPNALRVQHENEQFTGTRSPSAMIQGVYPEVPFTAEGYLEPAGTLTTGATVDTGDDPPQGDKILRQLWGAVSLADSQNQYTITAIVGTADRDSTVITIGANSFVVNDFIQLQTAAVNVDTSGAADTEVRRITAIAGGVDLTVKPGFSKEPIITGTADKVQGVRMYKPTKGWNAWLSGRILEGAVGKQLTDGKVGGFSVSLSAEEPIKISFELTFLSIIRAGIDAVFGESGVDFFAATDTVLDVGDASKYEIGAFVDLKEVTVATDVVAGTEKAAEITALDKAASPNTLTLVRGTSAVATTDQSIRTGAQEVAGPYDLSSNKNLKFRVSGRKFVTFDMTTPTAPMTASMTTAAEAVANGNTQLRLHKDYGFLTVGRYAVKWDAVFVDNAGTLEMHDPTYGSQSVIEVATAASLSLHATLFTGTFTIKAVEEVQIHPHDPGTTEQGKEQHGHTVIVNWGSYCLGVNNFNIGMSNNPRVVREMKKTANPLSIIAGRKRTYDISCELLQRQDAAAFFDDEASRTSRILHVQSVGTVGEVLGWDAGTARILTVTTGGDEETTTMQMTIEVTGTSDDEMVHFYA